MMVVRMVLIALSLWASHGTPEPESGTDGADDAADMPASVAGAVRSMDVTWLAER
jgi:hypothetical protein